MLERITATADLDVTTLMENNEYVRRAYVSSVNAGVTSLSKGFFTFYLKDVNSNVVAGRKFDIADFIATGFEATSLKNKMVDVDFKAQKFNGNWSLVINTIKISDNTDNLDGFVGKIDLETDAKFTEKLYSTIYEKVYILPVEYKTLSLHDVCQGRCGGVGKLFTNCVRDLYNYKDLPSVDFTLLMKIFADSFKCFVNYRKQKEMFDVMNTSAALDHLFTIKNLYSNNTELALDVTSAILGLAKPQHLYAHLISDTVEHQLKLLNLVYTNSGLALGSSTNFKGVSLLRY